MVFWCHFRVPYKQHPALADSSIEDPIAKTVSSLAVVWCLAACNCCLFHFPKASFLERKKVIPVSNFLTRNNEVRIRLCIIVISKGEHLSAGNFILTTLLCRRDSIIVIISHHYTICPSSTILLFSFYIITPKTLGQGTLPCHHLSFLFSLPLLKFSLWLERLCAKE